MNSSAGLSTSSDRSGLPSSKQIPVRWGTTSKPKTLDEYNERLFDLVKANKAFACYTLEEDMLADGIRPSGKTYHSLIAVSEKAGRLQDVLYYFQEMKNAGLDPGIVMYNYVIGACATAEKPELAFSFKEEMDRKGLRANLKTFKGLLEACATLGDVQKAQTLVMEMEEAGCNQQAETLAALIIAHTNQEAPREIIISECETIMNASPKMCKTDRVPVDVFNAMLTVCLSTHSFQRAEELLENMYETTQPSGKTSELHVQYHLKMSEFDKAVEVLLGKNMEEERPYVNTYLITMEEILLKNRTLEGHDLAMKLLEEFLRRGYFLNAGMVNSLLPKASHYDMPTLALADKIFDRVRLEVFLPQSEALFPYLRALEIKEQYPRSRFRQVKEMYHQIVRVDAASLPPNLMVAKPSMINYRSAAPTGKVGP